MRRTTKLWILSALIAGVLSAGYYWWGLSLCDQWNARAISEYDEAYFEEGMTLARWFPFALSREKAQRAFEGFKKYAQAKKDAQSTFDEVCRVRLARVESKIQVDLKSELFLERDLFAYVSALNDNNCHVEQNVLLPWIEGPLQGGALKVQGGFILRQARDKYNPTNPADFFWNDGQLYQMNGYGEWSRQGRAILPTEEIKTAFNSYVNRWKEISLPQMQARAEKFFAIGKYAEAAEVGNYILSLDPEAMLPWLSSAASDAAINSVETAIKKLKRIERDRDKALEEIRKTRVFMGLIRSSAEFRSFVYQWAVAETSASAALRQFRIKDEGSCFHTCEDCESCPDWRIRYVLENSTKNVRIPMTDYMKEDHSGNGLKVFPMTDVGSRIFSSVLGNLFEVSLSTTSRRFIAKADLLSDSNDNFPLIIGQKQRSHPNRWRILMYDGHNTKLLDKGVFKLAMSEGESRLFDGFCVIQRSENGYEIFDQVSGDHLQLASTLAE